MSKAHRFKRKKREARAIAAERLDILLNEAEKAALEGKLKRADRYAELAGKIRMKVNLPLPPGRKGEICRGCKAFLLPGKTARVRVRDGRVVRQCLRCGRIARVPYSARRREYNG